MKKSVIAGILCCLSFNLINVCSAENSNLSTAEKINCIENALYGTTQEGSLVNRTESIEDDLIGVIKNGSVTARIDNLYEALNGNDKEPSLVVYMNMAEWKFQNELSNDPIKSRVENFEKNVNGTISKGCLLDRMNKIVEMVEDGHKDIKVCEVTVPKDTVVKLKLSDKIGTKINLVGDKVDFTVAENVFVNDILTIVKGTKGTAQIIKISHPGIFGKDGKIVLNIADLKSVSGENINAVAGKLSKQKLETAAGAGAATVGGLCVLGPLGVVGGAFVKGANIEIPAESILYVQTTQDTNVYGVLAEK